MRDVWARGLAIADGRIPDDVDPDSAEGRHYARLIEYVRADVAKAPPMSMAAMVTVVTLLRGAAGMAGGGGGDRDDRATG